MLPAEIDRTRRTSRSRHLAAKVLLGLLGCWLALGTPAHAQTLRSAAQSGAPAKYAASDAPRPGLCRELVDRVERLDPGLRISGLTLQAPLRRIELMLEKGEIDVFFCLLDTPERRQRFNYLPVPLYRVRHVVVQRADDPTVLAGMPDLAAVGRRKPVLVAQGSVLARTLAKGHVPFSEVAGSDAAALRMLVLGRADAVYGQDMSLLPLLKSPELAGKLRVSDTVFFEEHHYAVVGRHVPKATVERIGAALATLERQGLLRDLAERYRQP